MLVTITAITTPQADMKSLARAPHDRAKAKATQNAKNGSVKRPPRSSAGKCFCLQDMLDRSHRIPKELDSGFFNPLKPDRRLSLLRRNVQALSGSAACSGTIGKRAEFAVP